MANTVDSMEGWEAAPHAFLEPWKAKRGVVGAVATGSYGAGTATPYSDVDVHIVLAEGTAWRERGNQEVSGFLIEYFANPPRQIRRYMETDFEEGRRVDARMFAIGAVVFDKTGVVAELRAEAARWMRKPFKVRSRAWKEQSKYAIWECVDTLRDLSARQSSGFPLVYFAGLEMLLVTYAQFLRAELPASGKLDRFLTDSDFRARYRMPEFQMQSSSSFFSLA